MSTLFLRDINLLFCCSIPDAGIIIIEIGPKEDKSTVLQQARVTLMPNSECKVDPTIGKYVTDNSLCITSDDNDKFTCPVCINDSLSAIKLISCVLLKLNSVQLKGGRRRPSSRPPVARSLDPNRNQQLHQEYKT